MQTDTLTPLSIADSPTPDLVEAGINAGIRRLGLAVLVQAIRDASATDRTRQEDKDSARAWLLEEGASWARCLGMRIGQAEIEAWINADCPPGDKRAGNGGKKRGSTKPVEP